MPSLAADHDLAIDQERQERLATAAADCLTGIIPGSLVAITRGFSETVPENN